MATTRGQSQQYLGHENMQHTVRYTQLNAATRARPTCHPSRPPAKTVRYARAYVATRGNRVVGYYTLPYGSVEREQAAPRVRKGLARHPIPVIVLARLAIDRRYQGQGLGKGLLKDALLRTLQAADIAGLRTVVVHAKDESAKMSYGRFGFEPSRVDEFHLMLLLKDLRKAVTG